MKHTVWCVAAALVVVLGLVGCSKTANTPQQEAKIAAHDAQVNEEMNQIEGDNLDWQAEVGPQSFIETKN